LLVFRALNRAVFVFGFAKKDKANITPAELAALRKVASEILALDAAGLNQQITAGDLIEVQHEEGI